MLREAHDVEQHDIEPTSVKTVLPPLRAASSNEAPAIAALVNTAFQVEAFFKRGDRTDAAEIRDLMQRGEFLVLEDVQAAAESDTVLAGCVYVQRNGDRAYFGMLSIDPRYQGRGLGRSIVAAVESQCRAAGCRELDIHVVNLREELPPFYERLGYVTCGTLLFPDDGSATRPCHFIVMTKGL